MFGVNIIQDSGEAIRTFKKLHDITQGSVPQGNDIPPDTGALGPIKELFRGLYASVLSVESRRTPVREAVVD